MASASILSALGADVSKAEAEEAVRGWLALREALGGVVDAQPESVARHTGKDGKGVFYVVSFEGGGYAVVSGDTELEPILAYSTEGEWVDDESRNPLLAMLNLDVAAASSGNGEQGTGNGWVDVVAEGVTPQTGVDYTFRFTFDYAAQTYSVAVQYGAEWKPLVGRVIPNAPSFPLATSASAVSGVRFTGDGVFTSLLGGYQNVIPGFRILIR